MQDDDNKAFHKAIDALYDHIMANGYRFNTSIGAVFLGSLYQENKDLAYDFLERWQAEEGDIQLTDTEKEHLAFAKEATTLKARMMKATPGGIADALKGPCGRREALRIFGITATGAATAPILAQLGNLFPDVESPQQEAEAEQNTTPKEEVATWIEALKNTYNKDWLVAAVGGLATGATVMGARRYLGQMNEKRDAIIGELSDTCQSQRVQAQLSRPAAIER